MERSGGSKPEELGLTPIAMVKLIVTRRTQINGAIPGSETDSREFSFH